MIYADNAATTMLHPQVLDAMLPYLSCGNPSSHYSLGRNAKEAIERARSQVASLINASPDEIFFTSGGSESDNWALQSAADYASTIGCSKPTLIYSAIEHSAILNTVAVMNLDEKLSSAKKIPVDSQGFVSVKDILNECSSDNINIISIMTANNEIGTIQPIKQIATSVHHQYPDSIIHTDAVQAVGHIYIDVKDSDADLLSSSAHKFHGPKGTGFLYIRKPLLDLFRPYINGGSQERGFRAGTENVAGIVGTGKAAEIAKQDMTKNKIRTARLTDLLINGLLSLPGSHLNGPTDLLKKRLPNNTNVRFDGISAEALLGILDSQGICASAGSACHAGDPTPSHVLTSIGLTPAEAASSVRFTLSEANTEEEVFTIIQLIKNSLDLLRGQ